jgi:hypothetical protein
MVWSNSKILDLTERRAEKKWKEQADMNHVRRQCRNGW